VLTIYPMIHMIFITHATQIRKELSSKRGITSKCRDLQHLGHQIAEAQLDDEADAIVFKHLMVGGTFL
jgi:hypothetical protein